MTLRWRKADESIKLVHCPDHVSKNIFYARTYTVRQGFSYSDTNQLVINLKHAPTSGPGPLGYKRQAIQRFAEEASAFFTHNVGFQFLVVPMPPSRPKGHAEHDDRLERVAAGIASSCANVVVSAVLETRVDSGSYHDGGMRSAEGCYRSLAVVEIERQRWGRSTGRCICILDDILTSGAHFEAGRRHMKEQFPDDQVIGVFWAKAEEIQGL
ncbi:MAG: hypothetical protein HY903_16890 [Deltaproteobacteria bacterium]|nr:hypothetical protein [Deltaproteobacteria bacterium]